MRRIDTRYIITHEGKTFVCHWANNKVQMIEDPRTPDKAMTDALDKGWEGRYAGLSLGTKTTESIVKQIGYDWEAHSVVALYGD